ncbi:hypothetical protein [Frigoriglobus tundricola]|uniref:Uncharacterized protein n=1 Tax=Frigoriglobus tundricola TaxID=2774151 RepID=A0A6M5YG73_9BACT|nr:hypothetical protein [Frigoriglobus tundricola]QJW92604.1 hypothetical protein FTUN_0101 [Frigoriglobus tundricola]
MMTLLRGRPFALVSPLSPEHCAARLNTLIVNPFSLPGSATLLNVKPLLGKASRSYISIRKLNQFNNALQPELTATLEPYGDGTRLHCRIGLTTISSIILPLITTTFIIVGTYGVILAIFDLSEGRPAAKRSWLSSFPLVFMAFGIWVGQYLARGEKEYLENLLIETLAARRE